MKKLFTLLSTIALAINGYSQIVITEINYNGPESGTDTTEFIELFNAGSASVNLNGYQFTSGVTYTFPNISIASGAYLVIAYDSAAIMNVFGASARQWTGGGLSNGGEPIALKDSSGTLVDSLRYDDVSPWPGATSAAGGADGGGATLVLCDSSADNTNGANWSASTHTVTGKIVNGKQVYGSPGKKDSVCTTPPPPPAPIPSYNIGTVTTENASGVADSLNVKCAVSGIVYGVDMSGTSSSSNSFTVIDATGGIAVFKSGGFTPSYTVTEGDSVTMWGAISQFNGLTQFSPDSIKRHSQNHSLKAASVVTSLGESTESDLIKIDSVKIVSSSQWPSAGSNANVQIETVAGDTLVMRIDRDTDVDDSITVAPTGYFSVTGLGGQFDFSSPYTSGYQILPRYRSDVGVTSTPPPPPPAAIPHYNLGVVTTEDASGVADSNNVACSVSGVVHGIDMSGLSSSSNTFQLFDATGHITVYKGGGFTPSYTVNESDSITLYGKVSQFNGLTQFAPDSMMLHKTGAATKAAPRKVSMLDESTESDYIKIDSVKLINPSQWPSVGSNANVQIETQAGDTLTMRIDKDSYVDDSVAAPIGLFDVTGYGGQFDFSSPYTSGYQILPQLKSHIYEYPAATCNAPSALNAVNRTDVSIELGWTTGGSNTWNIEWGVLGSSQTTITTTTNPHVFMGLMPNTSYTFRVQDSCAGVGTSPWSALDTIMTLAAPKPIPTYPISLVRTVDTDGIPDSIGVKCYLHGTVITPSYRGSGRGYEFHINDNSSPLNGINVIRFSGSAYTPRVGDSIRVLGEIDHYRGHIQLQVIDDSLWVLDSNRMVPKPMLTTVLDETTESKLLQMNEWELVDTTGWPSANFGNFDITNGTDTVLMRMDSDRGWAAKMPNPPMGKFCFVGVGGQFDNSVPHFGGYQILPRDTDDFISCPPPVTCGDPTNIAASSIDSTSATITWSTDGNGVSWVVFWGTGSTPSDSSSALTDSSFAMTGLMDTTSYNVWVQQTCATGMSAKAGPYTFSTLSNSVLIVRTSSASTFSAYPNPNSQNKVYFNQVSTVTLRNMLGQVIKTAVDAKSLNISELVDGMYLIENEAGEVVRLIVR